MAGLSGRHHGCVGIHPKNAAYGNAIDQPCGEVADTAADIKNAAMGRQRLKPF
jgi:hypothetical protein